MTLQLIDELTQTKGHKSQECIGQGIANFLAGAFGGMGGCATIGQSMINIAGGSLTRLSAITAAFSLLSFIVVANTIIDKIPTAALTGIMFNIVFHTFEWSTLRLMFLGLIPASWRHRFTCCGDLKIRRTDTFTVFLVTVVTLFSDLAVAVLIGIVFQSGMHAWDDGAALRFVIHSSDNEGEEVKTYQIKGTLFFSSVETFLEFFDVENDPATIRIEFGTATLSDFSALAALNTIATRYAAANKRVVVCNLQPHDKIVLDKASKTMHEGLTFEYEEAYASSFLSAVHAPLHRGPGTNRADARGNSHTNLDSNEWL
jgi:SulP family sulfate permease